MLIRFDRSEDTGPTTIAMSRLAACLLVAAVAQPLAAGAMTPEEKEVWFEWNAFEVCKTIQPGFAEKYGALERHWAQRSAAQIAGIRADLAADRLLAESVAQARDHPQLAAMVCHDTRMKHIRTRLDPGPGFTSAEKTWQTWLGALRSGDRDTALECLINEALQEYGPLLREASSDRLHDLATPTEPLRLLAGGSPDTSEWREVGYVRRADGEARVEFWRVAGEWKIVSIDTRRGMQVHPGPFKS